MGLKIGVGFSYSRHPYAAGIGNQRKRAVGAEVDGTQQLPVSFTYRKSSKWLAQGRPTFTASARHIVAGAASS